MPFAQTPEPPYTAVIFTGLPSADQQGYSHMSETMLELAARQPGYLGVESAREESSITVSYWATEQDAANWKQVAAHLVAQERGKQVWYDDYRVRIATVTRDYARGR